MVKIGTAIERTLTSRQRVSTVVDGILPISVDCLPNYDDRDVGHSNHLAGEIRPRAGHCNLTKNTWVRCLTSSDLRSIPPPFSLQILSHLCFQYGHRPAIAPIVQVVARCSLARSARAVDSPLLVRRCRSRCGGARGQVAEQSPGPSLG